MAVKNIGTNSNLALQAIQAAPGNLASGFTATQALSPGNFGNWSPADFATIKNSIRNDKTLIHAIWPDAISREGLLSVPNRGVLKVYPGDWVAVDNNGWPILLSSQTVSPPNGFTIWTHN